mmetsp:Transcript_21186/g.59170  ORF Transcript_21186/g.59170 Transcript_21186/m.59170 type:complete len:205 (+) Transcript_21186:95-709(+)
MGCRGTCLMTSTVLSTWHARVGCPTLHVPSAYPHKSRRLSRGLFTRRHSRAVLQDRDWSEDREANGPTGKPAEPRALGRLDNGGEGSRHAGNNLHEATLCRAHRREDGLHGLLLRAAPLDEAKHLKHPPSGREEQSDRGHCNCHPRLTALGLLRRRQLLRLLGRDFLHGCGCLADLLLLVQVLLLLTSRGAVLRGLLHNLARSG